MAAGIVSKDDDERSYALQLAGDLLRTQDAELLKQVLSNALRQETDSQRASELIWVLGKSCDARFIGTYHAFLREFIGDMPAASGDLYQTLIALDNCGEPVFERDGRGRSSQSILNVEKNLRQAQAYLANHKVEASL